ncbi:hypothetical protein QBC38DRAFT_470236 [Podospora fimiseda]|uniref:Methyltransferase domain-containing protein n=1 Tax=Podospora fimiseda TaxID=252190 RepID=A0AAN7H2I7_9PEZI|nr:hypothetical protein QBC38DRAFT_470236 [Podospora fimiseda]
MSHKPSKPLIPRLQVFEIADQLWFPSLLRKYMQAALTAAWTTYIPHLQQSSPAGIVARLLSQPNLLPHSPSKYVFIDFCAGAGGPTPQIEKHINSSLTHHHSRKSPQVSYAQAAARPEPVKFILTDLHPHEELWSAFASASPNLTFIPESVDASNAPASLTQQQGKKVFRLFNLAFHHFDDTLARKILKNTVDTSDGFGIFELQDRTIGGGFVTCCLFGVATMLLAPYYAFVWKSPLALVFTYLFPALPFVLVWDGWMSSLRTRTAEEVEQMLRGCGGDGVEDWVVKSGSESFMWPVGKVNWVVGYKK